MAGHNTWASLEKATSARHSAGESCQHPPMPKLKAQTFIFTIHEERALFFFFHRY
jgi:hypothetical protein